MQEKTGIAFCASTYSETGRPPRVICAAPVLVPQGTQAEELPLWELYDHPDFIDLISAREFGLEQILQGRKLLGVMVATVPEGLKELLAMITDKTELIGSVICRETDEGFWVQTEKESYPVVTEPCKETFLTKEQQEKLPLSAVLAALTVWCCGYTTTFYQGDIV